MAVFAHATVVGGGKKKTWGDEKQGRETREKVRDFKGHDKTKIIYSR